MRRRRPRHIRAAKTPRSSGGRSGTRFAAGAAPDPSLRAERVEPTWIGAIGSRCPVLRRSRHSRCWLCPSETTGTERRASGRESGAGLPCWGSSATSDPFLRMPDERGFLGRVVGRSAAGAPCATPCRWGRDGQTSPARGSRSTYGPPTAALADRRGARRSRRSHGLNGVEVAVRAASASRTNCSTSGLRPVAEGLHRAESAETGWRQPRRGYRHV